MKEYTHYGTYYGIPVLLSLDEEGFEMEGKNSFWNIVLEYIVFPLSRIVSMFYGFIGEMFNIEIETGFPIKVRGEIEQHRKTT